MKEQTRKIIESELNILKDKIIQSHLAAGQKASGKTIASLNIQQSDENSIGLFGKKYFSVLETGRKPGNVPKGFYKILLKWIEDKGITVEKPETLAYFTAQKIANEGTKLFRDGGRTDIFSPHILSTKNAIESAIGKLAIDEVTNIKINL